MYQYIPYLERRGVSLQISPLLSDEYVRSLFLNQTRKSAPIVLAYLKRLRDLLSARRYDILWIEKEIFPWLPAWAETLLSRSGAKLVTDYDDAVFHRYDQNDSGIIRLLLSEKISAVMRTSKLALCGNDYLMEYATRSGCGRVELLPSVVDLDHYPVRPKGLDSTFTVGWVGSPVTFRYIKAIVPALQNLSQSGPIRFVAVGAEAPAMPGVPTLSRPWAENHEAIDLADVDVGVMPLDDSPFERGKCGYKLIQYMACGIPTVASPVGANRKIVRPEENGFWATTTEEWIAALNRLRSDASLRSRLGQNGRGLVEKEYSVQAQAPRLLRWFEELVN